jgi:hypothetical protein
MPTPIQKYYDTHKLCRRCGQPYDDCICIDEEVDIDYAEMVVESLTNEV